jgi:hypothetical protein
MHGAFPDWGPLAEDSAAKLKRSQLNVCTMYVFCVRCTLFPLWLKSVPGWPAFSVSTFLQFRVGQIVWFGCLSAISQLASRVGEGGGVRQLCLHSVTQPYTTWPRWREQGGWLHSLPLDATHYVCHLYDVTSFSYLDVVTVFAVLTILSFASQLHLVYI